MTLMELSVSTTDEAVDWVCTQLSVTDYLTDVQVSPLEMSASHHLTVDEQLNEARSPWTFTIRLYLPYDRQTKSRVNEISALLSPLHRTGLTTAPETTLVDQQPDQADFISSHQIGDRVVVLPSEASYSKTAHNHDYDRDIVVRLKQSLAFGSGLHPATILSLRLLERYITPAMNVLDLGSGSGILSVAIAKLGAKVLALDNDTAAVEATQDAVSRNQVEHQVIVMEGSLGNGSEMGHWMGLDTGENVCTLRPDAAFDLIVANILARVHIALAPDFRRALRQTCRQSGVVITAGYTTDYEADVTAALTEEGFKLIDCERLDNWVALAHQLA